MFVDAALSRIFTDCMCIVCVRVCERVLNGILSIFGIGAHLEFSFFDFLVIIVVLLLLLLLITSFS